MSDVAPALPTDHLAALACQTPVYLRAANPVGRSHPRPTHRTICRMSRRPGVGHSHPHTRQTKTTRKVTLMLDPEDADTDEVDGDEITDTNDDDTPDQGDDSIPHPDGPDENYGSH